MSSQWSAGGKEGGAELLAQSRNVCCRRVHSVADPPGCQCTVLNVLYVHSTYSSPTTSGAQNGVRHADPITASPTEKPPPIGHFMTRESADQWGPRRRRGYDIRACPCWEASPSPALILAVRIRPRLLLHAEGRHAGRFTCVYTVCTDIWLAGGWLSGRGRSGRAWRLEGGGNEDTGRSPLSLGRLLTRAAGVDVGPSRCRCA